MKTLNDPVPGYEEDDDWTPKGGLRRAIWRGTIVAVILAGLLAPAAYYVPQLLLGGILRAALGFAVAWILFGVVQRAAGMVGGRCSALSIALAVGVLLSNHIVFAIHGVPTNQGGPLLGWWFWFDPRVLGLYNGIALIGVAGCACLRHSGGADAGTLVEILTRGSVGDLAVGGCRRRAACDGAGRYSVPSPSGGGPAA